MITILDLFTESVLVVFWMDFKCRKKTTLHKCNRAITTVVSNENKDLSTIKSLIERIITSCKLR